MWFRYAVQSLPLAIAQQVFFLLLGEATGFPFRQLTFTPFGFIVFYFYSLATLWSLGT